MENGFSKGENEELRQLFFSQSFEILEELQDLILKLEADPADAESLRAVQRYFHTLKGDSASLGFTSVSSLCHRVEDVLSLLKSGDLVICPDLADMLLGTVDRIEEALRQNESGVAETVVFDEEIRGIERLCRYHPAATEKDRPRSEYQFLQAEQALARGEKLFNIIVEVHPGSGQAGAAVAPIIRSLAELGDIIHCELPGENPTGRMDVLFLTIATTCTRDELERKLALPGISGSVNALEMNASALDGSPSGGQSFPSSAKNSGIPDQGRKKPTGEVLRIEAARVDWILNLVGELIIGRSIIDQIARDSELSETVSARLNPVNAFMERTISDLQKGVMKMRMVPVNAVFRKFPKIVRQLAAESGKKVRLELFGRETELDKGIVEALVEPLVHLVRNAIDHGIEEPLSRLQAGKAEEATITMRAYHEANHIVMEVADDGRGIDLPKLRMNAIERGYKTEQEVQRLSDSEVVELIYVPGLSTSEALTDISGRGIGMDAVRSSIKNMNGGLDVATSAAGTLFTIRLPLTLAVIRALLFETGNRTYALPVFSVREVARVSPSELVSINGTSTLLLREKIISLIRMDRSENAEPKDPGQKKFVLVLSTGQKNTGLLVDRIIGQQELVIKAADFGYGSSGLVSGASILGTGRVVFILDAAALCRKAVDEARYEWANDEKD